MPLARICPGGIRQLMSLPETKDLYALLGLLPGSEDVVITAAYRGLTQRYHPEPWKDDPGEANDRIRSGISSAGA